MSNKAKYHGVGGPLTVTKDSTKTPVIGLLMEAAAELGYKVGDINGEGEDGCFTPGQVRLCFSAANRLIGGSCTITKKAPTRAFS